MTVPFANIPSNLRVPLFYAEFSNAQANTAQINQRALIIGQMLGAGDAKPNIPLLSLGVSDAKARFGQGSQLALMVDHYRKVDTFGELWCLPLNDDGAAVAATGSVTFTAAPTANGTLNFYIGNYRLNLLVAAGQSLASLATALAAAISGVNDLAVTAAVSGGTPTRVDVTAKNKGLAANDIVMQLNYRGTPGGEGTPAGLSCTIAQLTGGTTNPALTTALANLTDMPFDAILLPYTDTASLDVMKAFMGDTAGRWAWNQQIYGHVFTAKRGTGGNLQTFGLSRNDQHAAIMGFDGSPTPEWLWGANVMGAALPSLRLDPARPLQTLPMPGVLAPPVASRFPLSLRNSLLYAGISTYVVADDGTVAIENLITTYQQNSFGQPDNSYLQVETMFTLMAVVRFLKIRVTSKYARCKLADDGTRFPPGSDIITPNLARAELIAGYLELVEQGLVDDPKGFAKGLIVERDKSNRSRLNVLYDPTLVSGLRIWANLIQFRI